MGLATTDARFYTIVRPSSPSLSLLILRSLTRSPVVAVAPLCSSFLTATSARLTSPTPNLFPLSFEMAVPLVSHSLHSPRSSSRANF